MISFLLGKPSSAPRMTTTLAANSRLSRGYSAPADSDDVAQAFRDDVARYSDLMSPGAGVASLANNFWHQSVGGSTVYRFCHRRRSGREWPRHQPIPGRW